MASVPDVLAATGGPPGSRRPRTIRPAVSAALALAVLGAATWVLVQQVDAVQVQRTLAGLRPSLLAGVVVLEVLAFGSLAQVYRTTYRLTGGTIPWQEAVAASMGAFTLTQLLPGGGAAGAVYVAQRLRRTGASTGVAAATVVLTGLVMMGTLGVVVGLTTGGLALAAGRHLAAVAAGLGATVAVVLALVVLRRVGGRPRGLLEPTAWAAGKWLVDAMVLTLVAHALGVRASVATILVALGVANLVAALPLTPGGIGFVEAGMAGVLVAFGVDPVSASLTAVSYRVVAQWLPVAVALPVLARGALRRPWQEEVP